MAREEQAPESDGAPIIPFRGAAEHRGHRRDRATSAAPTFATANISEGTSMLAFARPLFAAALVATGAIADRAMSTSAPPPGVAASAQFAVSHAASAAAGLDAVTEHAYSVASPSVVYVENVGIGSGSGVIYDSTGDIVTNDHVIEQAQKITVTLSSGKTYTASLLGTDAADDLAIIHIGATGLPAAHFTPISGDAVAQTVLAIGSPLGLQQTVTSGLISALNRTVQESNGAYLPNAVQTSAPINPGNSGGALVNLDGQVVGIPTLEASDPQNNNGGAAQGIGFAIPSDRVTTIAHQIITTGKVAHTGRAYLGLVATDASQAGAGFGFGGFGDGSSTAPTTGAVIETVASGSPAAQAGLQQGDVITAANGTPITGESALITALAKSSPGATMNLTVVRSGSTMQIKVVLGELAASQ